MKKVPLKQKMIVCLILLMGFSIHAQEINPVSWNQFRGPHRNGTLPDQQIPSDVPASGPQQLWKIDVGAGFSEVTALDDRIYTLLSVAVDTTSGQEYAAAFEATTGKELWRTAIDSLFFDQFGDGPRSTPVVDDTHLYCLSSHGKLSALALKNGKIAWQVDVLKDLNSTIPRWGFSSSPVLVNEVLILETGGADSKGFSGFDRRTGELLWTKGEGVAHYSSPVVAEIDGVANIIFANQTTLYSFNSEGDTLWTYSMTMNGPMASPVFFGTNKIFISTVRSQGFSIVEVNGTSVEEVLHGSTMKNDFSSSLYYDGYIYGFNVAALQCISATTGEKTWTKRGLGKGSLIRVGDDLLILSDKGKLVRAKATPEAYTEVESFQALEGKSWTAPSFANGRLYVRNLTEMACYSYE